MRGSSNRVGLILGAVLVAAMLVGCTPDPSKPRLRPLGDPESPIWIAGDSTSQNTAKMPVLQPNYNIAEPGAGFVIRSVQARTCTEQIRQQLEQHGPPETLIIMCGGNDVFFDHDPLPQMRAAYAEFEALGIDVRFVTEPFPTTLGVDKLEFVNIALVAEFDDTINCWMHGYPTGPDGAHPNPDGYIAYSQCIRDALDAG